MQKQTKKYLVPKSGLRVICPELSSPLPKEGDYRHMTPYWWKRKSDQDIEVFDSVQAAKKAEKKDKPSPAKAKGVTVQ